MFHEVGCVGSLGHHGFTDGPCGVRGLALTVGNVSEIFLDFTPCICFFNKPRTVGRNTHATFSHVCLALRLSVTMKPQPLWLQAVRKQREALHTDMLPYCHTKFIKFQYWVRRYHSSATLLNTIMQWGKSRHPAANASLNYTIMPKVFTHPSK